MQFQAISNLWQQSTKRYPILSLVITGVLTYYTGWPLWQSAFIMIGSALATYGVIKYKQPDVPVHTLEENIGYTIEELINQAEQGNRNVDKIIAGQLALLKRHHVRIMGEPSDLPHQILKKTLAEQQREKAELLENPLLTDDQKAALNLADPTTIKETHSAKDMVALDEQLNTLNMAIADAKLAVVDPQATTIYMCDYGLTRLPVALINKLRTYAKLHTLAFSDNKLTTLPDEFGCLTTLRELRLNNNKLSTLPDTMRNLKAVERLEICENEFTTFPDIIGQLTTLNGLNIDDNKLTSLSEVIGNLKNLTYFSVRNNRLSTLPNAIQDMSSLHWFYAEYNLLTSVPAAFGNLRSLIQGSLNNNKLKTLPDTMVNLNANYLCLENNPFESLPASLNPFLERTGNRELIAVSENPSRPPVLSFLNKEDQAKFSESYAKAAAQLRAGMEEQNKKLKL